MKNHFPNKIYLWILRSLNITTREEEKELESLIDSKENLKRLADIISDPNEYIQRQQLLQEISPERELQFFLQKYKKPVRRLEFHYWKVAAILLIPMLGSFIAWQMLHHQKSYTRYAHEQTNIRETQGAMLILSDGTLRQLSPDQQIIQEADGAEIKTDSGSLNYTAINRTEDTTTIYNNLIVGRGFEYMLTLEDGTKVWMNSESELHYPVRFTKGTRKIKLTGEAYLEVAHDPTRPFIVEVNNKFKINVLGTHFNIKAYPTDDYAETTLLEGKVSVSTLQDNTTTILKPSEQIMMQNNGKNFVRVVDTDHYTAWHNGWFFFSNERLTKALEQIGRWYNVDFHFETSDLENIPVTGKLKRFENLEVVLDILSTTTHCQFNIQENQIYITTK